MSFAIIGLATLIVAYIYTAWVGSIWPPRDFDGWVILALVGLCLFFLLIFLRTEI